MQGPWSHPGGKTSAWEAKNRAYITVSSQHTMEKAKAPYKKTHSRRENSKKEVGTFIASVTRNFRN